MHKTVLFVRANDPVAEQLQQEISRHGAPLKEANGLATAFLVMRRFQSTAQPVEVASQMLMSVDPQYVRYLNPSAFKEPYEALDIADSRERVRQWLAETDGSNAEPFLDELFGWVGTPIAAFTNKAPMFKVTNCDDHGVVLVGSNKICMLWFMKSS